MEWKKQQKYLPGICNWKSRQQNRIFNLNVLKGITLFSVQYLIHPKTVRLLTPFNTLRPRQDGRHFPDDIFKCMFLNENVWILITILLKIVP